MDIVTKLKTYNQEHLIKIIEKMDLQKQEMLLKNIEKIDFDEINNLYAELNKKAEKNNKFEPMEYIEKENIIGKYEYIGEDIIKNNKYAVVTMAGGQGTRLGHNGPKGTYMLNIRGVEKTIFELLSENFINAKKAYGVDIPWYIMTSCNNDMATREYFEKHKYFGLKKVKFFTQMDIPILSEDGKLLIGEDFLIKNAGNGNGGIYKALDKQEILQDMEKEGIEWVFVSGVDNILAKLVDPLFLGLTCAEGTEIASKATSKNSPDEKVGVFCKRNGKCGIVEYIETSEEMKEMKDKDGKFVYSQANILQHLYSLNALKKLKNVQLPYHIAHKKNSYLDEFLTLINPDKPNTYKFEQFIFDAFEQFDRMTLLSVKREEEFAPIKNATDFDCPETAVKLYVKANTRNEA